MATERSLAPVRPFGASTRCCNAVCCCSHSPQVATIAAAAEAGPSWASLSPQQRTALAPLQRDWAASMPRASRSGSRSRRVSTSCRPANARASRQRMTDWARLTPSERGQARLNYQERQADQRRGAPSALAGLPGAAGGAAARAGQPIRAEARRRIAATRHANRHPRDRPGRAGRRHGRLAGGGAPGHHAGRGAQRGPSCHPARRAPSHTCPTPCTRPAAGRWRPPWCRPARRHHDADHPTPTPPAHQQAGMPKIAATPGSSTATTLLPQRGPQGAGAEARAANAPGATGATQR